MLELKDIHIGFEDKDVLAGISLKILPSSRMALVGKNGAGKSTLLRIIAGELEPTAGSLVTYKPIRIGYLPQTGLFHRGNTLWDEVSQGIADIERCKQEQRHILQRIKDLPQGDPTYERLLAKYGELETWFRTVGGYAAESRIWSVLCGLGFEEKDRDRPTDAFSGGWQMRIGLAKLLVQQYDLLLLDEPTDHLDLDARNWLVEYLGTFRGAFCVVSHDRYFLDMVAQEVVEIVDMRLALYKGNYSFYLEEKARRADAHLKMYVGQQQRLRQLRIFIDRNRSRKDRAGQVKSRVRRLEKEELLIAPRQEKRIRVRVPDPRPSARRQIELASIEKWYDQRRIFSGIDLVVERGEKIGVVGRNGSGKSTLLRILAGLEPFQGGSRQVGRDVSIGYFCQDHTGLLDPSRTVLGAISACAPHLTTEKVRTLLGALLFRGDEVFKEISMLSGGERARVCLASLLAGMHNVLLLDEPTNHLDISSKEALLEALSSTSCTVVFVSHDRYFINELATRIIEVGNETIRSFLGNYESYQHALRSSLDTAGQWNTRGEVGKGGGDRLAAVDEEKRRRMLLRLDQKRRSRDEKKRALRIGALEEEIASLEKCIADIDSKMCNEEVGRDYERLNLLYEEKRELECRLEQCLEEWSILVDSADHNDQED